jgi:prepilin-type N-terminal cleavage/methylation domain-containing protein
MASRHQHSRESTGFSIVELVITIAIISILLSIATLSFNSWQVKSNVEAQAKQMVADISELRVSAMTRKQRHTVTLNTSSYKFKSYSSDDEPKCTGGTDLPGMPRNVSYKLKRDAATYYTGTCSAVGGDTFEIDQRGMLVGSTGTVFIDYAGGSASLDCLTLSLVRVNVGKTNGANCDDK